VDKISKYLRQLFFALALLIPVVLLTKYFITGDAARIVAGVCIFFEMFYGIYFFSNKLPDE